MNIMHLQIEDLQQYVAVAMVTVSLWQPHIPRNGITLTDSHTKYEHHAPLNREVTTVCCCCHGNNVSLVTTNLKNCITQTNLCTKYGHPAPLNREVTGVCCCCHGNCVSLATIYAEILYFPNRPMYQTWMSCNFKQRSYQCPFDILFQQLVKLSSRGPKVLDKVL